MDQSSSSHITNHDEILNSIHPNFFLDLFDEQEMLRIVLADNEEIDLESIQTLKDEYERVLDVINMRLSSTVMSNYTTFVQGMNQIHDIGTDITTTSLLCKRGRKTIQAAQHELVGKSLSIVSKYKQKKSLSVLLDYVNQIDELMEENKRIKALLESEDFPSAIELMVKHQIRIGHFSHFKCLGGLESFTAHAYSTISKRVEFSFLKIMKSFNSVDYQHVLVARKLLEMPLSHLQNQMHSFYINGINNLLQEIVLSFALRNPRARNCIPQLANEKNFKGLCQYIPTEDLIICFLQTSSMVADSLKNFYIIYSWHLEHEIDAYLEILSKDELHSMRLCLEQLKMTIWNNIQDQFSILISNCELTRFRIEKYVQLYHTIHLICELGEEFSEHNSHTLRGALKARSKSFLNQFHGDNMENFRLMIEGEAWHRVDIEDFDIEDIPEFGLKPEHGLTISDRVAQNTKDVRMFLHSEDVVNPFKLACEKNSFSLSLATTSRHRQIISPADDRSDINDSLDDYYDTRSPVSPMMSVNQSSKLVLTNASMTMIRRMGSYVYAMETMPLLSIEIFEGINSIYQLYVYSVYAFFSQNDSLGNRSSDVHSPERDTNAPELLRIYFNEIRDTMNKICEDHHFIIPRLSRAVNLRTTSIHTHFAFYERVIAVESMIYLQEVLIILISSRISELLPKSKLSWIEQVILQMESTTCHIRGIIYERVAHQLFDCKYEKLILDTKWDISQFHSPSAYVNLIMQDLQQVKFCVDTIRSCHENIPLTAVDTLWKNIIRMLMDNLIAGYSKVKKCSYQGRALMQLDLNTLSSKLIEIVPNSVCNGSSTLPYVDVAKNYINGYYCTDSTFLDWIRQNRNFFSDRQVKNLAKLGPAKNGGWRSKREFLSKVDEVYRNPHVSFNNDSYNESRSTSEYDSHSDTVSHSSDHQSNAVHQWDMSQHQQSVTATIPQPPSSQKHSNQSIWGIITGKSSLNR